MDEQRIQVATNLRGPVRTEVFQGREYRVVPAVLVKSKVLYNNLGRTYLPADAITPEWAEMANGSPVVTDHPRSRSARNPKVMNELGIGFVFNATAENGALKAEVYIDPARVAEVPDLKVILEKLEAGKPVEGSTGFPVGVESTSGVHNGVEYDVTILPTGFDHYATFAEQIGACSVEDGCGLAQNKADGCGCNGGDMPELPNPPESPEEAVKNNGWRAFVEAAAKLIGLGPVANENGGNTAAEPEEGVPTPEEGSAMNREQMIAKLAKDGPLDAEALNKLSDCQLKALSGAENATHEPAPEGDTVAWQKAKEWREKFEKLDAETQNARATEEKERADLLDDLLYNARQLPWSENEIRAMGIVELRKIHKTAFPQRVTFGARGGPAANGSGSFDFVQGIMDGPSGSSVLDKKEAN